MRRNDLGGGNEMGAKRLATPKTPQDTLRYPRTSQNTQGWLGGAMVLGKFPVLGRSTNLHDSRTRAYL